MAENLSIPKNLTKSESYEALLPQIEAVISPETDLIANMANVSAMLFETFSTFFWVGFYRVQDQELVLGPFQGPLACTRIPYGKGVCGKAWEQKETLIVPNVNHFPGHIACSELSQSEIVVPKVIENHVKFVLDIDSTDLDAFDATDQTHLEKIVNLL